MKIFQNHDNGNLATGYTNGVASHRNTDNRSWLHLNNTTQTRNTHTTFDDQNKNCNVVFDLRSKKEVEDIGTLIDSDEIHVPDAILETGVCNKQYRINSANTLVITCTNSEPEKLANNKQENNVIHSDSSPDSTPVDEERTFEQSDTDEMSENILHPLPRGIVNPNYPGFQHLAHTLQEYSTNIETFYHSENEMTDDDLETDIVDQPNTDQSEVNINNNIIVKNNNKEIIAHVNSQSKSNNELKSDIPDLLKTLSNNNNIDCASYDCSATDIENNFNAKDIIGNFNKEIEDEIKQLLNYNINIEDDLEELRKDIKDTFAKPIENTINNISDVVNHVIKKLVETHNDSGESAEHNPKSIKLNKENEELNNINKDNETNTRTEMNLSRPTFLLIENHTKNDIKDALLSDGKDEINFYENDYDAEALSHNVENTIKQLSTELRKIIPKLNEMRDRDRFWTENIKERPSIIIDRNSNEINNTSNCTNLSKISNSLYKLDNKKENKCEHNCSNKFKKSSSVLQSVQRMCKDRHVVSVSTINTSNVQNAVSVIKNDSSKDCDFGSFDVYNIETALPEIDLDAIENHLKAAKEAERRKRNDREEIRKRLAMDADSEEYYSLGHTDRPGKKPSLHSRLQNGKNLQICFMNETASDNESQTSDMEKNLNCSSKNLSTTSIFGKSSHNHPYQTRPLSVNISKNEKISTAQCGTKFCPSPFMIKTSKTHSTQTLNHLDIKETDFYTLQARLQSEARIALAQAKEMARIQMERERHSRSVSPVTEMLRHSMEKANAPLTPDRRRVSRQLLTDMNIAQLQVIVNELHSQIESLNDTLVKLLMARDELHMGQDSMLVDIEDLTRYLGVKEQTKKTKGTTKSGVRRLTSLVHK